MLDVKTLKVARQVSKSWNSESTSLMFSKGYLRVPFNFYKVYETLSIYEWKIKENKESQEMMKSVLSSSSVKIKKILMKHYRDQNILLNVLDTHNVDVTELKIPPNWEEGKILREKLPNLNLLTRLDSYGNIRHYCCELRV